MVQGVHAGRGSCVAGGLLFEQQACTHAPFCSIFALISRLPASSAVVYPGCDASDPTHCALRWRMGSLNSLLPAARRDTLLNRFGAAMPIPLPRKPSKAGAAPRGKEQQADAADAARASSPVPPAASAADAQQAEQVAADCALQRALADVEMEDAVAEAEAEHKDELVIQLAEEPPETEDV